MNSKQLISRNIEVFYNNASEETDLIKEWAYLNLKELNHL